MFILLISNGENILNNVNVVALGQVKSENRSLPVGVRVSETRVLKLPNILPKVTVQVILLSFSK